MAAAAATMVAVTSVAVMKAVQKEADLVGMALVAAATAVVGAGARASAREER